MTPGPPNASTVIGTFRWWVLEADAKDEGVAKLIAVARTNRNREVRKQAMF